MTSKLFAIKYREKGEKQYYSAVFAAKGLEHAQNKVEKWLNSDDGDLVDKRTLTWAGGSVPLTSFEDEFFFIPTNLDEYV